MAVIGDYGNRLAIVARQHALNRAAPVRLEGNPLANGTVARLGVRRSLPLGRPGKAARLAMLQGGRSRRVRCGCGLQLRLDRASNSLAWEGTAARSPAEFPCFAWSRRPARVRTARMREV